jgi:hypothetical protein
MRCVSFHFHFCNLTPSVRLQPHYYLSTRIAASESRARKQNQEAPMSADDQAAAAHRLAGEAHRAYPQQGIGHRRPHKGDISPGLPEPSAT